MKQITILASVLILMATACKKDEEIVKVNLKDYRDRIDTANTNVMPTELKSFPK